MAKTIKFNLICDGKPVRTIEDLQENFSIEDVLKYYENGLLLRWLDVRGYETEYKKVSEIKETEALEIVKELIRIFGIEADEKSVEQGVYMLQFLEERKILCEAYKQDGFKTQEIIDDYQAGYKQLVDDMVENPKDVARIKADIAELMSGYKWVMDLTHRRLFWRLREISPLAIMCLLMNDEARKYYLPIPISMDDNSCATEKKKKVSTANTARKKNEIPTLAAFNRLLAGPVSEEEVEDIEEDIEEDNPMKVSYDIEYNADKRAMYDDICEMIKTSKFASELGNNLHVFSGVTDGYWKDLEPKGKKYMIISMGKGDFVRSAGVQGGDLSSSDIENNFVIVDGIDYKSNSEFRELTYMEV